MSRVILVLYNISFVKDYPNIGLYDSYTVSPE